MSKQTTSLVTFLRTVASVGSEASLSDSKLLERYVRDRDEAAFSALVRRHAESVWGVCRRILGQVADADDAFQAVFLLLSRKAALLRKPELVGAWLYGVARKVALRARNRRVLEQRPVANRTERTEPDPLDVLTGREVLAVLDEELLRLSEEHRAVILLCCLEGKSRQEAAEQLGWSEGSVKGRLERGRELLSKRLTRRGLTLPATLGIWLALNTTSSAASLAAGFSVAKVSPTVVTLANSVGQASSGWTSGLGKLAGVLLLVGLGFGAVVVWKVHSGQTPNPESLVDGKPTPPSAAKTQNDQPAPEKREVVLPPEPPAPTRTTVTGRIQAVDGEQIEVLHEGQGDDSEERQPRRVSRVRLIPETRIIWAGVPADRGKLSKGQRITARVIGEGEQATVESVEILTTKRERVRPEGQEKRSAPRTGG